MASTLYLRADRPGDVERAARLLREGGLVAFPTETVYGLGAHALSAPAVRRIFEAKGRPGWDPLIVHLAEARQLRELVAIPDGLAGRVRRLTDALWPGPLTLLLPRLPVCPDEVTAGRPLVGVRVPAHPVAQALLRAAGVPVAAPSANRFGHVSPTTAQHTLDDLDGRIDAVLDGGPAEIGVESTVVDPSPTPMVVYRAGAVTLEALGDVAGAAAEYFQAELAGSEASAVVCDGRPLRREGLPSPGVGLRHYAPEVRLVLTGPSVRALEGALEQALERVGERAVAAAESVCVLVPGDWSLAARFGVRSIAWGLWSQPATLAAELFRVLRLAEASGAATILCPLPESGGVGDALRDRLLKAAMPA